MLRAMSVCSGIGAPECAWRDLPIQFVGASEIEKFPSRVLAHRFPDVPNFGDMERIADGSVSVPAFDVLVGGTPCQSFSVAGLRGGLADARGNLALSFCRIAQRYAPEWVLWENVPGVLSSDDGRAFGSIIGALVDLGYGIAWRILDAQNFGVAQRRRRVFLVGHSSGALERARAVLFESEGVRRDPAPRSFPREDPARGVADRARERGEIVAFDPTQITSPGNRSACNPGDPSPTLAKGAHPPAIAFHHTQDPISGPMSPALGRNVDGMGVFVPESRVRRVTPLECERLQGFPDGWTDVSGASDSARYRALGNSMAVPVLEWLGRGLLSASDSE